LEGDDSLNTLVDFRFQRNFNAESGEAGKPKNCTGRGGNDLILKVPVGTTVIDEVTQETLGDITGSGDHLLVAKAGFHGLGNTRYKSSTNRAPRQTSLGGDGESRHLKLELKILADVGLLGLPNAGKSTFIRSVSAAQPKVADYPFTTLVPNLGVVSPEKYRSFVIADIPGLVQGAADGAGLGIRFLKHLTRTLYSRERWLVLNKTDLLSASERKDKCMEVVKKLGWTGPVYCISGISSIGTDALCQDIMNHLDKCWNAEQEDSDIAVHELENQTKMQVEARERIKMLKGSSLLFDDEVE